MKAPLTLDARVNLPAETLEKYGLDHGGDVFVEDRGDAIVPRTVGQVVARAQNLSRALTAGKTGASVEHFLSDRAWEAASE